MNNAPAADRRLSRLILAFYLTSIALLPWSWFPPFPLSRHNAQWSDAVFSVTAALWVVQKWRTGLRPHFRAIHIALICYFGFAALSLVFSSADKVVGSLKLLGIAELCLLAVITSDLAKRPKVVTLIARVVAVDSLLIGAASVAGLLLFYAGIRTPLIGIYGDLVASPWYGRAQAGTYHPNLLASFCIFASAVVAHSKANVSIKLRRAAQAALWVAVALTFSRAIFGFVIATLIRNAHTRRRRAIAAACAAVFVGVIVSLSVWNLSLDPTRPLDMHIDSNTAPSRRQAAVSSLHTLVANPVFGSGPATHPGRYRDRPFDAHLTPLNIAATLGLPALAAFTAIFVLLWRDRDRAGDVAIWSGLAGLALDALASDIEDFRHLWVMIGLADAAAEQNSSDPEHFKN